MAKNTIKNRLRTFVNQFYETKTPSWLLDDESQVMTEANDQINQDGEETVINGRRLVHELRRSFSWTS